MAQDMHICMEYTPIIPTSDLSAALEVRMLSAGLHYIVATRAAKPTRLLRYLR